MQIGINKMSLKNLFIFQVIINVHGCVAGSCCTFRKSLNGIISVNRPRAILHQVKNRPFRGMIPGDVVRPAGTAVPGRSALAPERCDVMVGAVGARGVAPA